MRLGVGVRFPASDRVELVAKVVLRSRAGASAFNKVALTGRATARYNWKAGLGSVPIITTATMSIGTNPGFNALIGTVAATNSPTAFAITGGNPSGYFTINNGGNLRTGGSAAPPDNSYSLTVTASNSYGTSPAKTISVTVGAIPAVANQSMNLTLPATTGEELSNVAVTAGSPTGYAITAGNASGFFAIDNTGLITVTAAGAAGITAQTYNLTVRATNALGSGTGSISIIVANVEPVAFRSLTSTSYAQRTNTTLAAPAGLADGDILVAAIFAGAQTAAPTVTLPPGFTALAGSPTTVSDGSFQGKFNVAWKRASSESGSYTFNHSSASSQGALLAISGATTSGSPVDVVSANASNGSLTTASSVTTTANGDLLLFLAHDWEGNGALSPPSGMTEIFDSLIYTAGLTLGNAGATGAKTMTNGNPGAIPWAAWLVALKPANAPPPTPPVVTNASFSQYLPLSFGAPLGTVAATGGPTSWAITGGNSAGFFAVDNVGNITVANAAITAATYTLTIQATNSAGSGTGTAVVTINDASDFVWPDATNTGVPPGTTLTNYTGPATINTAGTIVDSKIITGMLTVTAPNVIIRNCLFTGNDTWQLNADTGRNITVQDCEFRNGTQVMLVQGTIERNNIWNCIIGMTLKDGQSTVRRNFIHDMREDPVQHHDGMFISGGQTDCLIQDNWISTPGNSGTAEIFIATRWQGANIVNTTVDHNRLIGTPSFAMYSEQTDLATISGTRWTNNEVQRGAFGYWTITGNSVFRSGNKDAFTGANIDNQ